MKDSHINIIVALGKNRQIGKRDAGLLWHIPEDLQRFKKLTTGHPVIMGRKTWESLPEKFRPLPERTNIVVTRDASYHRAGALITDSVEKAFSIAKSAPGGEEVFVIGGGEIYALALPYTDRLCLTLVDDNTPGDVLFPPYEKEFNKETSRKENISKTGIHFVWSTLEK